MALFEETLTNWYMTCGQKIACVLRNCGGNRGLSDSPRTLRTSSERLGKAVSPRSGQAQHPAWMGVGGLKSLSDTRAFVAGDGASRLCSGVRIRSRRPCGDLAVCPFTGGWQALQRGRLHPAQEGVRLPLL